MALTSPEGNNLSGDRYRLLIDSIADYAIYMLDINGHVASWNPGAQRFKGYTADEILGQHFSRFYTPEDRAQDLPARALRTAATEGRFEHEGWRMRKDGSRFWAHVIIDPIHDEHGTIIGFAKVTRDLTERREAAQALAQTREELMQAQKMEAIGRLTGGVAHDFNNLLMAITGSLELLRKRVPAEPRLLGLIDNAMQGAQRGASLTQRMLAFARRQELKPDIVVVPTLLASMTELLTRSLGPDIVIHTDFDAALPPVIIDSNQLELALLNLAVNARDAMPDGGALRISAREATPPPSTRLCSGRYIALAIADTGTGMDADTMAHAAEPFFTTKGIGKGTGLGLAMVRGLCEQSGGALAIESKTGRGTTVTLWIPVGSDATLAPTLTSTRQELQPVRHKLRILVVDDDFLVAMNTTAMIEDLGHEAVEVHSGSDALAAVEHQGPFDVVVTDQAMPKMTGDQLIAALKVRAPEMGVVLATGYAELPEGVAASVPRLNKPFFLADLEKALSQVAASPVG